MTTPNKRPAHRPSRRAAVVDSAMRLFAAPSADSITVAGIAQAAEMTSAAVYYHFASKDDILLEGLRGFGDALLVETRRVQAQLQEQGQSVGELPGLVLGWLNERREPATVWFVTSSGMSLGVEQLRRELRGELIAVLTRAAKAARPGVGAAQAAVVAAALLSLLETAASSWLTEDESLTGLGRLAFLDETSRLAKRIIGA